jgi:hypothetical protein
VWRNSILEEKVMNQIVANEQLSQRLRDAKKPVRVVDENGQMLGIFDPLYVAPPGVAAARSPHTMEELEELRKQVGGRPLVDIIRDLEKRG